MSYFRFIASAILLSLLVEVAIAQGTAAAGMTCIVNDPTSSPLNIRLFPGGTTRLGTIPNGRRVKIVRVYSDDKGTPWAWLEDPKGWVFARYLNCGVERPERRTDTAAVGFNAVAELARTRCTMPLLLPRNGPRVSCQKEDEYDIVCRERDFLGDLIGGIFHADKCIRQCAESGCGMAEFDFVSPRMTAEDSFVDDRPYYASFNFVARNIYFFCKYSINPVKDVYKNWTSFVACMAKQR